MNLIYLYFRVASKNSYARAKRSLGSYYFYKNLYEKSIKNFAKALNINSYHSKSWFMLGYILS